MNSLYDLLKESTQLFSKLLELEHEKYDAVIKANIEMLDDIVSDEQAYYLKMRGDEQKRENLLEEMGCSGKTLREIIDMSQGEEKTKLRDAYKEFNELLKEVKKINRMCRTLIEVRLRRIDSVLSQLGENNTYTDMKHKDNNAKSLMISKKI
jgi:flagellar biosynthesis/type III secretory pathway chaperone